MFLLAVSAFFLLVHVQRQRAMFLLAVSAFFLLVHVQRQRAMFLLGVSAFFLLVHVQKGSWPWIAPEIVKRQVSCVHITSHLPFVILRTRSLGSATTAHLPDIAH